MDDMTNSTGGSAKDADALVTDLLSCSDVVRRILDHMTAFHAAGCSAPDAPPIGIVLREILKDVVKPVVERRRHSEVEIGRSILNEIAQAMCDEILLVSGGPRAEEGAQETEGSQD